MILPIVAFGTPILRQVAKDITPDHPGLSKLIEDMWETMYASKGVGLAAPQIGSNQRVSVIDISVGEDESKKLVIINPEIVAAEGRQTGEEGCLSIPGFREPVTRSSKVTVRAQDASGATIELTGDELLARAFEHEIDHLNGILFINHLSALKRDIIRRKIKKLQKSGEWE